LELLLYPGYDMDGGKLLPVPANIKKLISPWAKTRYCEFAFGYILIQQFISRKFSIHIWQIHITESCKLYPASDRPTIAIQVMLEGEIPCMLVGFGKKLLKKSTYELFYVPVSINEAQFEPGDYESFHIELEPGFLEDIAESYPDARELLERFNNASEKGIPMISIGISYVTRALIKNIRTCDKTNGDLIIELHRYIVDLLSEYVAGIRELERDGKRKNIPHKDILIRIKQEITADPNIGRQELKKLSLKYRMSITELKKDFKALFGQTPGSFIRFHALKKAHYLITTTKQSIDEIADDVGYGYRSNFDKSFKKQFGFFPSHLR
jgi:AraC-like DNA-binding protein